MTRFAILIVLLSAVSIRAMAQDCTASAQGPDALWATAPIDSGQPEASLKVMSHLHCLGCGLELSMLLTAGPASKPMPLGEKTGLDWAKAVVEDPAQREGFLQSVLRSERRSSPGCSLQGRVGGVAEVGNLGMIRTDIHAECAPQSAVVSAEFYSGYDGICLYQVQFVWGPGFQALSAQGRYAVQSLLKSVRFGR